MIIRLVPNTGIQYQILDPIKADDIATPPVRIYRAAPEALREIRDPASRPAHEDDEDFDDDFDDDLGEEGGVARREREGRRVATADARELLGIAASMGGGLWIPLPFDRGGVWACLHLKPDGADGRYLAALAIDTTLVDDGNPEGFDEEESGLTQPSPFAPRFWRSSVLKNSVRSIVDRILKAPDERRGRDKIEFELQLGIAALAEHLSASEPLKIQFAPRPEKGRTVPVDLVIDLGNSRTCVLLSEQLPQWREERLELVYPDDPHRIERCPFDSQFAFVSHEVLPFDGGQPESGLPFRFLSQIVVGERAGSLLRTVQCDPQTVGMTSPKRYLWETSEQVRWTWRLANETDERNGEQVAIRGDILRHMNPPRPLEQPLEPRLPAQPNHPRQAAAVWSIVELLEQAFRQVNSPRWRRADQLGPAAPLRREIANVVLMYPAGMHSEEVRSYLRAAERAAYLWSSFRSSPAAFALGERGEPDPHRRVPNPKLHVVCDEGLAIQACWIYGEIVHRYSNRVADFIKAMKPQDGRAMAERLLRERRQQAPLPAGEPAAGPSLRVASLDVGGGTIDIAIADYAHDGTVDNAIGLTCRRVFHDGISRAGDEIVRTLLEGEIFPQIVKRANLDRLLWADYFTSENPERVVLRRQLVRNVWMPLAKACLESIERDGQFESSIGEVPGVDASKLEEFGRSLIGNMSLQDVKIKVDRPTLTKVVRSAIGRTIQDCCDIISQYECDALIVGGRPTSNPVVRKVIENGMPVPPGQIVFLSEWSVGDWYPFVESARRVGDAKTCGVVGASIAFRALYGRSRFRLRAETRNGPDPIMGIPLYDRRDQAATAALGFDQSQEIALTDETRRRARIRTPIQLGANEGMVIALRRIASERAEAAPIYLLRLKSRYREKLQASPVAQGQVELVLERKQCGALVPESDLGMQILMPMGVVPDVLDSVQIDGELHLPGQQTVPASEALELVLRTMLDGEGYWIDTGRFRALSLDEGADGGAI